MNRPRSQVRKTLSRSLRLGCGMLAMLGILILLAPTAFAKTYVITDGGRTITYTAGPNETLDQANTEREETAAYTTQDGAAITITRGLDVRLSWRGKESHVSSYGETVGELLARLDLDVTSQDTLSHPLDAQVTDGMELTVDCTIVRQETYTTTVPHEVSYCADISLPKGTEEVLIQGRDGELLCTAQVTYRNGVEVEREVLSESQTIVPITQIVAQGTGDAAEPQERTMPIIGDGYIVMPSGEVLTYYKTDYVTATGYTHTDAGCDMITSTGTTVHYGTAAVDPRFIPYGTRMLIVSLDGERYYGIATAEDCGGAIKRDKMDLYFSTHDECIEFGRRRCTIYFLG